MYVGGGGGVLYVGCGVCGMLDVGGVVCGVCGYGVCGVWGMCGVGYMR